MNDVAPILVSLLAALILSYALVSAMRRYALAHLVLDHPNERVDTSKVFPHYLKRMREAIYDGKRPAVAELAKELGINYMIRPDNRHAKAGNLNHAFDKTNGEFIVILDADPVVDIKNTRKIARVMKGGEFVF